MAFLSSPSSGRFLQLSGQRTHNRGPEGTIIGTGSWRRADDVEPSFFTVANAQNALVNAAALVGADGAYHRCHTTDINQIEWIKKYVYKIIAVLFF